MSSADNRKSTVIQPYSFWVGQYCYKVRELHQHINTDYKKCSLGLECLYGLETYLNNHGKYIYMAVDVPLSQRVNSVPVRVLLSHQSALRR